MEPMSRFPEPSSKNTWEMHCEFDARRRQREFGSSAPESDPPHHLTQVQINALISGEVSGSTSAPELAARVHRLCAASGQTLRFLSVHIVPTRLACPRCGDRCLYRAERRGFLQLKLFPLFGYFPWKCESCGELSMLKLRCPPAVAIPSGAQSESVGARAA